jgi:hypothetical protein
MPTMVTLVCAPPGRRNSTQSARIDIEGKIGTSEHSVEQQHQCGFPGTWVITASARSQTSSLVRRLCSPSLAARALASGRRAEIADLLAQGERPVEQIAGEIGQSIANTSHHLRAMAPARIAAAAMVAVFSSYSKPHWSQRSTPRSMAQTIGSCHGPGGHGKLASCTMARWHPGSRKPW